MLLPAVRDLITPTRADILEQLKLSKGLSVSELAERVGKSYMGVKQNCEALSKQGFAKPRRVPRGSEVGRPQKMYELTGKADGLFPTLGAGLSLALLEAAKVELGSNGPEKLLFRYFQGLAEGWRGKMAKARSLVEKCTLLVDLRRQQGILSRCEFDPQKGFRIEQYHNAMVEVFEAYPTASAMELKALSALLGTVVRRESMNLGKGRTIEVLAVRTL